MERLIRHFSQFLSDSRIAIFNQVLENRTRYLTVVLEDIFQSQNASAVIRTCDCLGIQDIHVIENRNKFRLNRDVVRGSSKWLNIYRYNKNEDNTGDAIASLRANGYRIIATSPHIEELSPENLNLGIGKAAFFFGAEHKGLTNKVLDQADEFIKIPIYGFTESYNISVSAAIILYNLIRNLRLSGIDWQLDKSEKEALMISWLRENIKRSDLIEKAFLKSSGNTIQ